MKFYRSIYFLAIFSVAMVLINSCNTAVTPPTFVTMRDVRFAGIKGNSVHIKGNAIFNNPNAFSVDLVKLNLVLKSEGKDIGRINQDTLVNMPASGEFPIPITANLTFKEGGNLFNQALGLLTKNEIVVQYSGTATLKVVGVEIPVPVNTEQKISL